MSAGGEGVLVRGKEGRMEYCQKSTTSINEPKFSCFVERDTASLR